MTNNISRRFNEHQKGLNPRSFTYKRRPVELIFQQRFNDVFQAFHFESRIKKWTAKKKRALAAEDFDRLSLLSICQNDSSSAFASSTYVPIKNRKL